MYQDFHAVDRWTKKKVHCIYQALIVAIATRHADAVDIKFLVDGRTVWVALPHPAWVEYKKRTGKVITDQFAVEIAGHYLKTALESGEGVGREMYSLTVDETLQAPRSGRESAGSPARQLGPTTSHVGTDVLICPVERSSTVFSRHEISGALLRWADGDICPYVIRDSLQPADQQLPLVNHLWRQMCVQKDEQFFVPDHFRFPRCPVHRL